MIVGSPQIETAMAADLARALDAVVVAPAYRLAPEHPYPAQIDDAMTTLDWIHRTSTDLGVDAARVGVVGASAGGGLAALVAQRAFDEGGPVQAQAMIYPMLDDRTQGTPERRRGRLVWTPEANDFAWSSYLAQVVGTPEEERACAGRRTNLHGLPPAWIGVGDLDLFHDEDVAYAQRLEAAGVPTQLVVVPGIYHGADGLCAKTPSMVTFLASMTDHLRAHLDP
jgi:acetyl esterase/lipase